MLRQDFQHGETGGGGAATNKQRLRVAWAVAIATREPPCLFSNGESSASAALRQGECWSRTSSRTSSTWFLFHHIYDWNLVFTALLGFLAFSELPPKIIFSPRNGRLAIGESSEGTSRFWRTSVGQLGRCCAKLANIFSSQRDVEVSSPCWLPYEAVKLALSNTRLQQFSQAPGVWFQTVKRAMSPRLSLRPCSACSESL